MEIPTIIISGIITFLIGLIMWRLNRKNIKAQTESFIVDQYDKLTARLTEERKDLERRVEKNDGIISALQKKEQVYDREIRTLKEDNEECKYLHEVSELEMMQLKKQNDFHKWKREMVFAIDDDDDVLEEFKHKFNKLSVLDYEGFHDVDKFLAKAKLAKPPIVVLDYLLNRGRTAEYVIANLGYEPEVFIMSGEKNFKSKFAGRNVQFFVKDDNFVLKIAKAIIQHLISKN